jgi:chromosome segregation protein
MRYSMKIKRLEIIGFKSFVDKAALDFPHGITAVVGPNGCGKSNIVDAIRWVMGEQSAKNLRGRNMEDIIFGGSDSRKPLGMAEVSLFFSTADHKVPAKYLNFSEIQVTRRLYRDGESEYLLNKTPCRLMDIAELFMDTGVGARAYSIIEQGRIGMILLSKPEERRFLIEEAAGVTKFKARKQIAMKKIDLSRQNLLRLGDIIAELKRQLNSLQRQAKKAERFREYREELRGIELGFALAGYTALSEEITAVAGEISVLDDRGRSLEVELEAGELGLEGKRLSLLEDEKALSCAQEEQYRCKGEIQAAQNRLEFQQKEMLQLDRQINRLHEELTKLQQQFENTKAEHAAFEERRVLFESESAGGEDLLLVGEQDLAELTGNERELSIALDTARRDLFATLSEIAQLNNQQTVAAKRLTTIEERFERSEREKSAFQARLVEAADRCSQLQLTLQALAEQKQVLNDVLASDREHEVALKSAYEAAERELTAARDELSRKRSRLHSLEELEARFAGYGSGVRNLMLAERFKGAFKGMLADCVETDEQHEATLEAVLGEKLQYLICSDDDDVFAAVEFLKETSGGRCSLILPDAARHPVPSPTGLRFLADKVAVREDVRELIGRLLADTCIADDLQSALQLARQHPGLIFATLQGDLVGSGGVVSGGSSEIVQQGLVHKKRELRDLGRQVSAVSEQVQGCEEVRTRLKREIAELEDVVRSRRQQLHDLEIRMVNCDKDLQRAREESRGVEEHLAVKGLEDDQLREESDGIRRDLESARQKSSACEERKVLLEAGISLQQENLSILKRRIDEVRDAVTGFKVKAAALKEKREANSRAIRRVEDLGRELQSRIAGHREELQNSEQEQLTLKESLAGQEVHLSIAQKRLHDAEVIFADLKRRYETSALAVQESETALKELRYVVDRTKQTLASKQMRNAELTMKLQNLENSIQDRHRLNLADIITDGRFPEPGGEDQRARQAELVRLIEEVGEVNLTAIDEYRESEERFNFLSAQKGDLEESLHALQMAIQRINKTTRRRFLETFHLVNSKFQEVFPRLFCGGRAELKLTNEEDLLETGIDIIVQPPGKKLQNVTLLSGGEKALTAVALIFSIFLIKPSPFCLLDEVDAPLDDANIGRFNEMVREMTAFSQFIMITHNKATMAVADTLFGVTMEEPGVSKLVSVKLN